MKQDESNGGEPKRERTGVELDLLRETYESATAVVKLGRRWLKAKPGPVGSPEGLSFMYDTFKHNFIERLFGFWNRYPESLGRLIQGNRPLADALQFLEIATRRIHTECVFKSGLVAERFAYFLDGLDDAREIMGEVLDDLEAEENPTLRPMWERDAKKLWYGDILCREYARVAPDQFQILDEFQIREWPRAVPSPCRTMKKLKDTIAHMNESHTRESPIRFEVFNLKPAWLLVPRSEMT
jgi:hypothetical protein